jgi:hypothetical protein
MQDGQLRINAPQVVHETIDGETILIHLGTGVYYSLEGTGAVIWELLAGGASTGEIVAHALVRYDADGEVLRAAVGSLIGELTAEGLIVLLPPGAEAPGPAGDASAAGDSAPAAENATSAPRVPFSAPTLNRYTDMQQFMLVDPIHDVEEQAGWPHVKAG